MRDEECPRSFSRGVSFAGADAASGAGVGGSGAGGVREDEVTQKPVIYYGQARSRMRDLRQRCLRDSKDIAVPGRRLSRRDAK